MLGAPATKKKMKTIQLSSNEAEDIEHSPETQDDDPGAGDLLVKDIDKLSLMAFNMARMKLTVARIYESAEKSKKEGIEAQRALEQERLKVQQEIELERRITDQNRIEGEIKLEEEKRAVLEKQNEWMKLQMEYMRMQQSQMQVSRPYMPAMNGMMPAMGGGTFGMTMMPGFPPMGNTIGGASGFGMPGFPQAGNAMGEIAPINGASNIGLQTEGRIV